MAGLLWCLWLAVYLYGDSVRGSENLPMAMLVGAPFAILVLNFTGAYEGLAVGALGNWCRKGLISLFVLFSVVLGAAYALKVSANYPRLVVGPWALATVVMFLINRIAFHALIVWRHRHGLDTEKSILVGSYKNCHKMAAHFGQFPELGVKIVAYCLNEAAPDIPDSEIPTCTLDFLVRAIDYHEVDRVIVCTNLGDEKLVQAVTNLLVRKPITVQYAPDLSALPIFCLRTSDFAGQPMINLSASPMSETALALKWLEDKMLASVILALISPLLILIAIVVKLSSPGPILFVQKRHGIGNKPIYVYKFRTMIADPAGSPLRPNTRQETTEVDLVAVAAASGASITHDTSGKLLAVNLKKSDDEEFAPTDVKQATTNDPRITAIGRFLRRSSLDELPQFFNVLKGDMSIVGPRPHAIQHNQQFSEPISSLMRRHYVKPGITGLAQIRGARGETRTVGDMRRRIRYDLEYIRNWSLWLDLKIIGMSILVGFFNKQP